MGIEVAERKKIRLRGAFEGPSGSGKTATGLITLSALAKHYGGKVGVIDCQHRQSLDYVGTKFAPDGFDVFHLTSGTTEAMRNAVKQFSATGQHSCLFIDSLSIAWAGEGGLLDKSAEMGEGFSKWQELGKIQNKLLGDILSCPMHVICTIQSKTEWVMSPTTNKAGKEVLEPVKVGMGPVQRKGIEYIFPLYCNFDMRHQMTITRINACEALEGRIIDKPDASWTVPLIEWLDTGVADTAVVSVGRVATTDQVREYYDLATLSGTKKMEIDRMFLDKYSSEVKDCTEEFLEERLKDLRARFKKPKPTSPETKE
jgi:hypothetical protein